MREDMPIVENKLIGREFDAALVAHTLSVVFTTWFLVRSFEEAVGPGEELNWA